ncbi:MAG: hypothetical protein K2Y71_17750 [Xanthobacteraceae bacterium]|nr:hypothetical protein [Xanthobacteraceae bacterium]
MSKASNTGHSTKHSSLAENGKLVIASGVAACLLLGTGIFWFLNHSAGHHPDALTASTVRPVETIRYAPAPEKKASSGPVEMPNVQPPQGTIRRMEAISGAFSKK